ncbi:helix-turn-helix domain-containing protein [Sinomicrobium oceani]|uniref:helix-turn-helix domain-containing protein n=1 Tax=Sinomicrobium oceani TaxID=1150368 RepID=UPI00227C0F9E|nr:helix-turn-helix domain-containing protein [Sinomicrobium oceani]
MKKEEKKVFPPVVKVLGNRIKQVINTKPLIQKNVAHDADLDVENLRKYMRGGQEMKISTLLRIANALQMTSSDLLKGIEEEIENYKSS